MNQLNNNPLYNSKAIETRNIVSVKLRDQENDKITVRAYEDKLFQLILTDAELGNQQTFENTSLEEIVADYEKSVNDYMCAEVEYKIDNSMYWLLDALKNKDWNEAAEYYDEIFAEGTPLYERCVEDKIIVA